jgi:hypothetical protein
MQRLRTHINRRFEKSGCFEWKRWSSSDNLWGEKKKYLLIHKKLQQKRNKKPGYSQKEMDSTGPVEAIGNLILQAFIPRCRLHCPPFSCYYTGLTFAFRTSFKAIYLVPWIFKCESSVTLNERHLSLPVNLLNHSDNSTYHPLNMLNLCVLSV